MKEKWKNEFEKLYNCHANEDIIDKAFTREIEETNVLHEMNMNNPLFNSNNTLNRNFTIQEISNIVSKSKNKKAAGIDGIPYEVYKNNVMKNILQKLFQLCFDTAKVPTLWRKTIICPIPKDKKNDPRIPTSYRGISLISCVAKLYSSLLNKRITDYLENEEKLTDEQNRFRKERSCLDHVFTLDSIVRNRLEKKEDTFAAFIDFQKPFDSINRDKLLHTIYKYGIDGKMYFAVKSLYVSTEACVKINNLSTSWFEYKYGV